MSTNNDVNKCPSIFNNSFSNPFLIERLVLIIYTIIFFIGLVGNIMTIIIIKFNIHLRTPTNFYLLNLAVSDLMMLMCNLPLEMIEIHYREWPLPVIFCKLRNICAEFFTCSSILTILAFTCERYFAIVYPIHFHQLSHFRRAQKVILIIWFISLIFSVPVGLLYEIVEIGHPVTSTNYSKVVRINATNTSLSIYCKSCIPKKSLDKLLSIIIIITSFCFFYFPMIIIGAIYLFIGKALSQVNKYENHSNHIKSSSSTLSTYRSIGKKQTPSISCHSSIINKELRNIKQQNTHLDSYSWLKTRARCQARKVVVKTLVAVVIAFFVCYAPLYLQRLLSAIMVLNSNLNSDSVGFSNMMAYLFIISGTTFYFGSVINPILYNVVSNKYRRAFRDLFFCRFKYITKTTTTNQRKLNHPNNQPIRYFIKTPPTLEQLNDIDANVCLQHINNTLPIAKRLAISSNPSSRSNSSSVSSQKREQYQTYCLRSNISLSKKMSSMQIYKPISGKKAA